MKKLMIVDDETQILTMLDRFLSKNKDLQISTYNNPETAITAVGSLNPDLILLDIMMPQMDGIEALGKIKQIKPDVKVIMMTAYSSLDRVLKSHREGADNYILKPFTSLSDVESKIFEQLQ